MSSRLTRMLLINVKTSGTLASGMITEIDPRDGAAITGANGVGKTTTLRLFPLFFGCPPSRIVSAGGSTQAMLSFLLPTAESVIVFEYQRGSPDELCFVTIRRQDGLDAPEYRFFKGPFRRELFVYDLPDGNGQAFYNDAGTVAAADSLGIARVRKLDSSQYRAVILRVRTNARDQTEIRRLTQQYSFSRRSLLHMDRLVANVVKEQVDFKDFTALALSMIYENMGNLGGNAQQAQPIRLRQTQEQIQSWLNNRDASANALELKEHVERLSQTISHSRENRQQLIRLKHELIHCTEKLTEKITAIRQHIETQQAKREQEQELEDEHRQALLQHQSSLEKQSDTLHQTLMHLEQEARHFEHEAAATWAGRLHQLTPMTLELQKKLAELDLIESKVRDITATIDQHLAELATDTARQISDVDSQTALPHQDYEQARQHSQHRRDEQLREQRARHEENLEQQQTHIDALHQQVGECRIATLHPHVDNSYQLKLEQSHQQLRQAQELRMQGHTELSELNDAKNQAMAEHHQSEIAVVDSRRQEQRVQQDLEQARHALHPEDGTLLARLRQEPTAQWRTNLARVIDPALLLRTDLAPEPITDGSTDTSLYGWSIKLTALEAPSWSDDEALSIELENQLERYKQAQAHALASTERLKNAAQALQALQDQLITKEAQYHIANERVKKLDAELQWHQQQLEQARDQAVDKARARLKEAEQQLRQAQEKRNVSLQQQLQQEQHTQLQYEQNLEQHRQRRDLALKALDTQKQQIKQQEQAMRERLQAERDRRLSEKDLDPTVVNQLRADIQALKEQIYELEKRKTLISQWQAWMNNNGPDTLATQQSLHSDVQKQLLNATAQIRQHDKAVQQTVLQHQQDIKKSMDQSIELEQDQHRAAQLLDSLYDVPNTFLPQDIDELSLNTIKGRIEACQRQGTELQRQLQHNKDRIYNELTKKDSDIKNLVTQHMHSHTDSSSSVIEQAQALQNVYRNLGHSVIANVNSMLGTVLENIGEFRKTIRNFEKHVRHFNEQLQTGLKQVSLRTERLTDLQIHVVCDFEKLDYLKKLDQLDSIMLDHRLRMSETIVDSVPSATTADALRHILALLSNNSLEINLAQHITLKGSANDGGNTKFFNRESELQNLSSTGITAIALITLLSGMLNVVRRDEKIYIPWVTDEVGRFDPTNFKNLMASLRDNLIDVVTASPALTPAMFPHFRQRYVFRSGSRVAVFQNQLIPSRLPDLDENSDNEKEALQ